MKVTALIPAYNPSGQLVDLVRNISASGFAAIIVVNDGSGGECDSIFEEIGKINKVALLRHAVNLGKGAALKTGLNYASCNFKDHIGVVTLDADGQHLVEDAVKVAEALLESPESLVMGVRGFNKNVPFRSIIGNSITIYLFRLLMGQKLTDTQTGLRGIPQSLILKLLRLDSNGYEFELDMLLLCKYSGRSIVEQEIQTVYIEGNKSSHFNPFVDSMKIYFVLFRFMLSSSITAVIDYTVFFMTYKISSSLLVSQVSARFVALLFNYVAVKKMVFYSDQAHSRTFPKYIALVFFSGFISYNLIKVLTTVSSLKVFTAKIIAESIIFLANFAIQRDFIFSRNNNKKETKTDWNLYYRKQYKAATFTRRITESVLHRLIGEYSTALKDKLLIGELGGGNSCFFDNIKKRFNPAEYHIIDNSRFGLVKFQERAGNINSVVLHQEDVLNLNMELKLDVVFSVGLIEHFSVEGTRKAIETHFRILKTDGIAIISFPTPTFLYRITRFLSEAFGLWIFHDERPLTRGEVSDVLKDYGTILYTTIIWPIFLTQMVMVVRNNKTDQAGKISEQHMRLM
jgi:glycosyltransferase involved in cell wall biosynthesis